MTSDRPEYLNTDVILTIVNKWTSGRDYINYIAVKKENEKKPLE